MSWIWALCESSPRPEKRYAYLPAGDCPNPVPDADGLRYGERRRSVQYNLPNGNPAADCRAGADRYRDASDGDTRTHQYAGADRRARAREYAGADADARAHQYAANGYAATRGHAGADGYARTYRRARAYQYARTYQYAEADGYKHSCANSNARTYSHQYP